MAKMRVMVVKYGYAVVNAETEEEALELTRDMEDLVLTGQILMMHRLSMTMQTLSRRF